MARSQQDTAETELRALLGTREKEYQETLEAYERRVEELEATLAAQEAAMANLEASERCHVEELEAMQAAQQETLQRGESESTKLGKALEEIDIAHTATADPTLFQARQDLVSPGPRNAAAALTALTAATKTCQPEALNDVKGAERGVRDVVVLRISTCATPESLISFEEVAEEAFDQKPLDRKLRDQLLQAYHKNCHPTFKSNNKISTLRRGRPRPRRPCGREAAELEAAREDQEAELAAARGLQQPAELAAATPRESSRERIEPWRAPPTWVSEKDLLSVTRRARRIGIGEDGRHAVTQDASSFPEARHFQSILSHYMQHPVECESCGFSFYGDVDAQLALLEHA